MNPKVIAIVLLMGLGLFLRLIFYYTGDYIYKEGDLAQGFYTFFDTPQEGGSGQYFMYKNALVLLPPNERVYYGDSITFEGVTSVSTNREGEERIVISEPVVQIQKEVYLQPFVWIKEKVVASFLHFLPPNEAGLLLGVGLGMQEMPDSFLDSARNAGVLHIAVASGQNVSILSGFLLLALIPLVKKRSAYIVTASFLLLYALFAGFEAPIVRATIMALVSFGALMIGKRSFALLTLGATSWIMLILDPSFLESVSFQLSFFSTLGILLLQPFFSGIFRFKFLHFIKEDLATTVSAQIITFPVVLASFSAYSLISIPVNILVLWTVPFLMVLGILAAIASVFIPPLAIIPLYLSYPLLLFDVAVIEFFGKESMVLELPKVSLWIILGCYLLLLSLIVYVQKRQKIQKLNEKTNS